MILPAQIIRRLCSIASKSPPPMIYPFHERTRENGLTYGLSAAGYDIRIAEGINLLQEHVGRTLLASSVERFHMPDDVLAVVHDKSTWARQGLAVQNTVIEPGWRGTLTLELTWSPLWRGSYAPKSKETHGHFLVIPRGAAIAQIVFMRLEEPTKQLYEGKYQDQETGAQLAKFDVASNADLLKRNYD